MKKRFQHLFILLKNNLWDGHFLHKPNSIKALFLAATTIVIATSLLSPLTVFAFFVDKLPEGNLIKNPWFRDPNNPNASSLDGWTDAGGLNRYWSSSQKESNPTSDIIIANVCGKQEQYCGTSARLDPKNGQTGGIGIPGVDAFLYQVVQTDSDNRKLRFFAYYVSHEIEDAGVSIYGGNSSEGPWDLVWVPLHYSQDFLERPPEGQTIAAIWDQTGFLEVVLERGYRYYKVEFQARLPEGNSTGFKMTGVYFTTEMTDEPPSGENLTTPVVDVQPTESVITPSEPNRTRASRVTETAVVEILTTPTIIPTIAPSATLKPTISPSDTPVTLVPEVSRDNGSRTDFFSGLLTGGLIVLAVFGGVFMIIFIRRRT